MEKYITHTLEDFNLIYANAKYCSEMLNCKFLSHCWRNTRVMALGYNIMLVLVRLSHILHIVWIISIKLNQYKYNIIQGNVALQVSSQIVTYGLFPNPNSFNFFLPCIINFLVLLKPNILLFAVGHYNCALRWGCKFLKFACSNLVMIYFKFALIGLVPS